MAESKRVLQPVERISEVLFGLIIVLTFTCSLGIAQAERNSVRQMLVAAVGCSLAWGIIDAVFYLVGCLSERGHGRLLFRQLRNTKNPKDAQEMIRDVLPPVIASTVEVEELEHLRVRLQNLPEAHEHLRLTGDDIKGAVGVFLLASGSILPVILPFAMDNDVRRALRISNAIAVVLLFVAGCALGRYASDRPWRVGVATVLLGIAMVALAILLGG